MLNREISNQEVFKQLHMRHKKKKINPTETVKSNFLCFKDFLCKFSK